MNVRTVLDRPTYFGMDDDSAHLSEWTYDELMSPDQDELLSETLRRSVARPTRAYLEAEKAFRQKGREQRLYVYLGELRDSKRIDGYTAIIARRVWRELRRATADTIRVPNASAGGEGQVLYTWNEREHHLELEIFPDGRTEFFYRNRRTGKLWDHDQLEGAPIPTDVVEKAALFPHA